MQKEESNYGFNIITEKIASSEFDEKAYESGNQSRQDSVDYTENAQILQCILQYAIKSNPGDYFNNETICKYHLIRGCDYYINLYKGDPTNDSSRFKEIKEEVSFALEQLLYLKALSSKSGDINNNLGSKSYKFTRLGKLLGFLLSYKNDGKCSLEQLYRHLLDYFAEENYSYAKLCFVFLKNCRNTSSPLFIGMVNSLFGY